MDLVSILMKCCCGLCATSRDTTNAVCHAIEAALLHGLKGSSIDKNFWGLLKKFMHKSTRSQISELQQISTDVGRCRAWIRVTMNECALESYLRLIVADETALKHYYRQSAFIRDIEQPGIMLTYIQGISELTFGLSTNSTVLNQWTSTTLALSGLLIKSDVLHAVVSPLAAHAPRTARPVTSHHSAIGAPARQTSITHNIQSTLQPPTSPHMTLSTSCPHHLDSGHLDRSMDSLQLTPMEIEAIRNMGRDGGSRASSASTPTSQLSHPDFEDSRPDIYRFVYDISPAGSRTPDSASASADGGADVRSPDVPQRADDSRFDEIVIASIEHLTRTHSHKTSKTVTICESEEASLVEPSGPSESLLTVSQSTESTASSHVVSEPDTQLSVKSSSTVHGSDVMVVSVGDALVAVQQGDSELVAAEAEAETLHQLPVITTTTGPARQHRNSTASRIHKESFGSLLKNYRASSLATAMKIPTVEQIIRTLPQNASESTSAGATNSQSDLSPTSDEEMRPESLEYDLHRGPEARLKHKDNLLTFNNEKGLSYQCYQCRGCTRPIGMFYGKERLCVFDGFYYCYECHENSEHYIPAYIVFNWDFRPYQVCRTSYEFLVDVNDEPSIDISQVNEHLYEHVAALNEAMLLRIQLHSLQAYLFSCKQPVAEELLSKVNGKSYLLDTVHLYSLRDLTQVAAGTFAHRLKKAVEYGSNHVYNCMLCSQKGFICELCHHPNVIYPFELTTTSRCEACKAVYHAQCKTRLVPCPRCARRHSSSSYRRSDPIERINFSFPSDQHLAAS